MCDYPSWSGIWPDTHWCYNWILQLQCFSVTFVGRNAEELEAHDTTEHKSLTHQSDSKLHVIVVFFFVLLFCFVFFCFHVFLHLWTVTYIKLCWYDRETTLARNGKTVFSDVSIQSRAFISENRWLQNWQADFIYTQAEGEKAEINAWMCQKLSLRKN